MPVLGDLREELNDITTFKHIAAAFTEASAVKLRSIRASFERNAQFFSEISNLYQLVEASAKQSTIISQATLAVGKQIKILGVALTSNSRFFGPLNIEIMKEFLNQAKKLNTERIVIGTTGVDYLKSVGFKEVYEKIIYTKDNPSTEELRFFLYKIAPFDRVLIFYPKFFSFLTQKVGVTDITHREETEKKFTVEDTQLIFEPQLAKMRDFFQTQVRLLLFKRVLLETDLARTAARLLTMSQAEEHSDEEIKNKKAEIRKQMRSFINAKLLETFAGMKGWKK